MGNAIDSVVEVATWGLVDDASGADAARDAAQRGAETTAAGQRDALEYLREREAIPQQFREGALQQLGGLYGLEGGAGSQQTLIEQAKASPLYSSLLRSGDEAALRTRSATGGLRSGGAIADTQDAQDRALLTSYNQQLQGLQGLANLPSNANQIAGGIAGIGQTIGQGQIAGSQAQVAAQNQLFNQVIGAGSAAAQAFSDIRLKENIEYIGNKGGVDWFSWDWNEQALELGLEGSDTGVMAHLLYETNPELIGTCAGFITVDYSNLEKPGVLNA